MTAYQRMLKAIERARYHQAQGNLATASRVWSTVARYRRMWEETRPTLRSIAVPAQTR